jgi:hypothetical protein
MTTTITPRYLSHHYRAQPVTVSFLPAGDRQPMEIDETTKQCALEEAVRKATAQLRRSVKLPKALDDGLYSPLSGRRVSPSIGRLLAGRISRCHQHI